MKTLVGWRMNLPRSGRDPRRFLLWAMWLVLGLYLVNLLWPGGGFSGVMNDRLRLLALWGPVAVCGLAVCRARGGLALIFVSLALASFAAGTSYFVLTVAGTGEVPSLSGADVGWLLFYPLILGGLFLILLGRRRLVWPVLVDGLIGSLGAAAVLSVVLSPLLTAAGGVFSLATAVAIAYPLFDLLVLAVAAGIAAVPGLATGRQRASLMLGITIFAVADVLYAFRIISGTYQSGTLLDAGWIIGLCLIAMWADDLGCQGGTAARPNSRSWAPVVPAVATAAGFGVLIMGTRISVSDLAVALAGGTLLAAGVRTQLAFRQLVTLTEVRRQSRTDELTGLPNRRALYSDVPARLDGPRGGRGAFLLLDVDRFKEINDSLGHDIGDLLLAQIGNRLSRCVRAGDLLARIGGDEFAILLDGAGREQSETVAAKLRAALAQPFTLEGIVLQVSVSVGIALFPDEGNDLKVLMRKADMSMYRAKKSRSGHHVYASGDNSSGEERLRTLQELRTALTEDQLVLHYQPKIDMAAGEVEGVEALVRWNHPGRGLLYPESFLLLTEEAGLMNDLTDCVLNMALDQAAIWHSRENPLTVAVNLSASSFIDAELPERILAMIEVRSLPSSALMVEITEESLMLDVGRAKDILSRLHGNGIRIAIDDFGTGYSSLAYLRDLPINELKLDRSFIVPMSEDPRAAALVASTINLAHSLSLMVVAEGVENALALDQLAGYGCDQAQGFHILGPVPSAALEEWLAARASTRAAPESHLGASLEPQFPA